MRGLLRDVWAVVCACALLARGAMASADGGGALQCPAGCTCAGDDLLWYYCGQYIIKTRDDGYVEINCQNNALNCSSLPRVDVSRGGPLQRLELTQCSLPPTEPVECAARAAGAAAGAGGAAELALQQALGGLTEDNVRGLNLTSLFMSFMPGALQSVPLAALRSLRALRRVRVLSGARLRLRRGMFAGAPPLQHLEISMSGVAALPAAAFRGLDRLAALSLWGNDIGDVSPDALAGLDSLQQLILNSNPLGTLPAGVFAPTPHLKRLCLERVRLRLLDEGVLPGLTELEEIKLRSDVKLALGPKAFSNLPSLTSLTLTLSNTSSLPADLFHNTTGIVNLTLSQNGIGDIPEGLFSNLTSVQRLDLSGNAIRALSRQMFIDMKSLVEVNLDGNRIQELPDRLFAGLTALRRVSLSRNLVRSVSYFTFVGASSLHHLSLSHNRLAWAPADTELSSPFHMLLQLQTLDLSHNNVSCVFSDWRYVLRLRALDLSYNGFTELTQSDVQYFGDSIANAPTVVDFRHNQIRGVQPRATWAAPSPLARLRLDHNPFLCDCRLYDFITDVQRPDQTQYEVGGAACAGPAALASRPLLAVEPRDLTCPVPAPSSECSCEVRPALARVECECDGPAAPLPDLEGSGLADLALRLRSVAGGLLSLPASVRELNLTGLNLTSVPEIPAGVALVDLSRNRLEAVPRSLVLGNATLLLARNPLACSCRGAEGVALLQARARRVADWARVACAAGARLAAVAPRALCAAPRAAAAAAAAAAALLLAAAAAAAAYAYRVELLVFLHARGWCARCTRRASDAADRGKRYDVFVSFAPEDERFVCAEVLPRLAAGAGAGRRVLVQDRDWEAGGIIPEHMHRSVERSRRTLILLSEHYLRSLWAGEGLRAVHARAAADRRPRAVVLLLGIKRSRLEGDARTFLSLSTVIEYGERMFWEKLSYALPASGGDPSAPPPASAVRPWKGEGLNVVLNDEGKLVNAAYVKDIA